VTIEDVVLRPWGRLTARVVRVAELDRTILSRAGLTAEPGTHALPIGNLRSYGDSCMASQGVHWRTLALDRFMRFDELRGEVECEPGILLADLLQVMRVHGFGLPVVPGTACVTVGGAIANDVHGKNHHRAGTFGEHLIALELLRTDGSVVRCSHTENAPLFHATIGGLGLTGLITRATLRVRRQPSSWVSVEEFRFGDIDEFFAVEQAHAPHHEYCVAWIDVAAPGRAGRGILSVADFVDDPRPTIQRTRLRIPFEPPFSLVNRATLSAFNALYFRRPLHTARRMPFAQFAFPLDRISNWNVLYGPQGFHQYQFVVPMTNARAAIVEALRQIHRAGQGSCLAVLKSFTERTSAGMLSFPIAGTTLALDFPNRGAATLQLLERLDRIVLEAKGRLYPAKDARMPAAVFQAGYPRWREFQAFKDARIESDFWRRVSSTGDLA
jgi:FAD/FMN-containing dehydrogenase